MSDFNDITVPTAFLREVAEAYANNERDNLVDYCFVTPNKRSGTFLQHHFDDILGVAGEAGLTPEVISISDFISELVPDIEATRIEQLLILYNVYKRVIQAHLTEDELDEDSSTEEALSDDTVADAISAHENETDDIDEEDASGDGANTASKNTAKSLVDFNRFQFWGDILLNDFNDVDRYVVDSQQIFKNVHDLKEISSNFLTPEQIEVINHYWATELVPEPVKEFWRHAVSNTSKSNKQNVAGFIKLWQVMKEIYDGFRAELAAKGLSYSGKIYRDAMEKVRGMGAEDFEYKRYVFVGFNVLSTSEIKIFEAMQLKGVADFYWDFASPLFTIRSNRANRFIKGYIEKFKSRYSEVGTKTLEYFPNLTVISVPSTFGQAKVLPELLKRLAPKVFDGSIQKKAEEDFEAEMEKLKAEGKRLPKNPDKKRKFMVDEAIGAELIKTAVVLPDENLIQPMLSSMPKSVSVVNVTMGFSLNHTDVAGLIKKVVSLQLRSRELRQEDSFFYDDVVSVLSHPLIRHKFSDVCDRLVSYINENRMFNIRRSVFDLEDFNLLLPIFSRVSDGSDAEAVFKYIKNLLEWVKSLLVDEAGTLGRGYIDLEVCLINAYILAVEQLEHLREEYLREIYLEDSTVFRLVEKIVGNERVSYDGVPLKGLQMMGVLESRALDFENLVMTSMNERIFPRRHYAKSFIPNALRAGYGMSTIEHQESMYAYYFYRLISRAKNVYLLYDSRKTDSGVGGPSRFLQQMRYQFPPARFHKENVSFTITNDDQEPVTISKDERIMKILERYRSEGDDARYLSASSINNYINCPLQFYLSSVERYYPENDLVDYMDDSTYGTIVHDALQELYEWLRGDNESIQLTEDNLKKIDDERRIRQCVEHGIRTHYLKKPDDTTPLFGDSAIYLDIMTRAIRMLFSCEKDLAETPSFVKAEEDVKMRLKVSDKHTINLNYRIDRVDSIQRIDPNTNESVNSIRLIDYKTGGDSTEFNGVDSLFELDKNGHRPKAVFQLMLYCNAFAQHEGFDGTIQPYIYSIRKLGSEGLKPLQIKLPGEKNKTKKFDVGDYKEFNDEFLERFDQLLDEIFDPEIPFTASANDHSCKYCKFKSICGIEEKS